ncbi:MAG TPA: hypothetical protein VK357_06520 [Rubrobacteraceae bacterium]|nr:hypothetical protein [Rubrobacteraceae bacterium]
MKGKTMLVVGTLAAGLVGAVPALAQAPVVEEDLGQVPIAMVDCVMGGPCVGTPGNDTITGSQEQDFIYGLEGDDLIDPGNDRATDYVSCGPGFDTVNQMPRVVEDTGGAVQYQSEPDFIADDCEIRAL